MKNQLTLKTNGYEGYYSYYEGNITLDMLNYAYGDKGRTFATFTEANNFSQKHQRSRVYTVIDYAPTDILRCVPPQPKEDAVPFVKAYLVSMAG